METWTAFRSDMMPSMSGTSRQNGSAQAKANAAAGTEALRRLKRGEMALDEYLDQQADLGVEHLKKILSPEDLRSVREIVRDQLSTDPAVAEMIAKLVGARASSPPRG